MIQGFAQRHRNFVLLAAVLFGQLLMVAFQIKRADDVRLIRVWAVMLITPFERLAHGGVSAIRSVWRNYVDLHNTRRENESLKGELGEIKVKLQQAEIKAAEADRLVTLLNFRSEHSQWPMVAARVIGSSAADVTRTIFINRGQRDGIQKNLAVITPDGAVGKVLEVFAGTAQILLLTDKESGVGALLATSRTLGVVKGTGGNLCRMEYVLNDEDVAMGETVFTSGQDRIYPKGIPVGRVTSTRSGFPFKFIDLKPVARLDRLEEVLVLLERPEGSQPEAAAAAKALPLPSGSSGKVPSVDHLRRGDLPGKPSQAGSGNEGKPLGAAKPTRTTPSGDAKESLTGKPAKEPPGTNGKEPVADKPKPPAR